MAGALQACMAASIDEEDGRRRAGGAGGTATWERVAFARDFPMGQWHPATRLEMGRGGGEGTMRCKRRKGAWREERRGGGGGLVGGIQPMAQRTHPWAHLQQVESGEVMHTRRARMADEGSRTMGPRSGWQMASQGTVGVGWGERSKEATFLFLGLFALPRGQP